MSKLSEEEIINKIEKEYDEKYLLVEALRNIFKGKKEEYDIQIITSQLLDLYNKEKEKNKELEKELDFKIKVLDIAMCSPNYISKDKIKEELQELDNMKVGGEVFITAVNFAKKILQELLEERN